MRTKLKTLVLLLIVAYSSIAIGHSQESAGFISSPEGMSTVGSIQSSVTNSGAVNVQIPLYTVSSGSIQVPIGLSYVSSGIKVDELPTCVGLGWKFSAGGKITRVVKTRPDDKKGTYGLWFYWEDVCGSTIPGTIDYYTKIYNKYYNVTPTFKDYVELDGEPDIFYFEIPGNAGMFVLDHNGTAHTIPYQNLSIQWIDREDEDNKDYFIITDANGCKYTFGNNNSKEISKVVYNNPNYKETKKSTHEYTSTWWLDKIDPFSGDPVTFSYISGRDVSFKRHSYIYTATPKNSSLMDFDFTEADYSASIVIYSPKYIQEIGSKEGKVKFTSSFNSTLDSSRKMDAFQVYNCCDTKIQDISFQYSTYSNDHLKLISISEINGSHTTPLYRFSYVSGSRPPVDTKDYDHWGYYNGKNNKTHRANVEVGLLFISGADRRPDHDYAISGLLNSIQYYNGKVTKFVYEANDIPDKNQNKVVGGMRVCEILTIASGLRSSVKYIYKKEDSDILSSGISYNSNPVYFLEGMGYYIVYPYSRRHVFDLTGRNIEYSRITEIYPNGSKTVTDYTHFETSNDYKDIPQRVLARYDGEYIFLPSSSWVHQRLDHHETRFWRRGLPIRTLTYDASSPTPIQTIENTYAFGPIKDTVESYIAKIIPDVKFVCVNNWISEPVSLTKTTVSQGPYNLPSETSYEYDDFQRPKTITQVDCENNVYQTRFKYASDYGTTTPSGEDATAIKYIAQNLGGANLPIETVMYRNGMLTGGNINVYKHTPDGVNKLVLDRTYGLALSQPVPSSWHQESTCVTNFVFDGDYQPTMYYDEYGEGNLLLSSHAPNSIQESVIYGYGNTLPVAKVTNARHSIRDGMNEVYYSSFEEPDTYNISIPFSKAKSGARVLNKPVLNQLTNMKSGEYVMSYWEYDVSSQVWNFVANYITISGSLASYTLPASASKYIDEVRIMPRGAYMTTYTYMPGVGKLSETDPNGRSIHYEYNEFGLLSKVYDDDWVLIKEINYDDL